MLKKKVGLEGVRIYAYHGYYPEEQVIGTEYLVDVETISDVRNDGNDLLKDTVNYEVLMDIVCNEMAEKRKLIETVALSILKRIKLEFADVEEIKVSIRKLRLPMKAELRNSVVEFHYKK